MLNIEFGDICERDVVCRHVVSPLFWILKWCERGMMEPVCQNQLTHWIPNKRPTTTTTKRGTQQRVYEDKRQSFNDQQQASPKYSHKHTTHTGAQQRRKKKLSYE